jgi:hypothetical protein
MTVNPYQDILLWSLTKDGKVASVELRHAHIKVSRPSRLARGWPERQFGSRIARGE